MKHYIASLILLASLLTNAVSAQTQGVAALPRHAQGLGENQRVIGYTLTDDIDINGAAFGTAGTYTIGAILTPDLLTYYAGCRIIGIRLAAAVDLGRTRCFLYSIGDNTMTSLMEQRQKIYSGWQNILFNGDGIALNGNETLFFGFDYTETDEMVAAEQGGICSTGQDTDGAFYLYQDSRFYSISNVGMLCVQLIVDISSLPLYNMGVTYFDTGHKYKQPGETIDSYVSVRNVGRAALESYQLGYQLDQQPVVWTNFPQAKEDEDPAALPEGHSAEWQFSVPLPADMPIGLHQLRVLAAVPSTIGDASSNYVCSEQSKTFAVYRESVPRSKTYLEVYTDQTSPYSAMLNDALKLLQAQYPQLTLTNVHRPGTPLAVDDAAYLHELYAYTWPTFTSNRAYFPGEAYIAYDMNDYLPVVGAEMTAGIISGIVEQDFTSPAFCTINLQTHYDKSTRQLTVQATGQALPEAEAIYGDLALTLLLTEDGVTGSQAVYNTVTQRTTTNRNYQHNQVLRGFMTAPTGDALQIDNNTYDLSCTTTLDDTWQPEKMTVVALLTKYAETVDDNNVLDMDVINCTSSSLSEASGITTIPDSGTQGVTTFYALDGKQLTASQLKPGGIYIVRLPDGTTRKVRR